VVDEPVGVPMQISFKRHRSMWMIALSAVALSPLFFPNPSPAHVAAGELVIDGAGWGHGIGMSQYGAYGRALAGQGYEEILDFYYDVPGGDLTAVVHESVGEPMLIGLEQEAIRIVLRPIPIIAGGTPATLSRAASTDANGALSGEVEAVSVPVGTSVAIEYASGACTYTVGAAASSDPGACNFDLEWDGWSLQPTAAVEFTKHWEWGTDPTAAVDATNCSRWTGTVCTYDYGELRIRPDNNRGINLTLEIDLNDYVTGIGEIPPSWPAEALKAQAVAARTFARYTSGLRVAATGESSMAAAAKERNWCWCTLYDSSDEGASGKVNDQVYRGRVSGVTVGGIGDAWKSAALATNDEVLLYQGEPIGAFYGSSNGGATQNNEDIWGGSPIPYLRSQPDPFTLDAPGNPYPSWTYTVSTSTLESRLDLDTVYDVSILETYESGTPSRIAVTGSRGGSTVVVDSYLGQAIDGVLIQSWYGLRGPHITGFQGEAQPPPPPAGFVDIDDSVHKVDIEYLVGLGVALACDEGPDLFCPDDRMRREDLAAFMVRALDLPPTAVDYFDDDDGLPFEADINSLAEAGITKGCNPPANDEFCPEDTVSRGQTAAFIVRAWMLTNAGAGDRFDDDDSSVFEGDIDRLAEAGITKGCNPPGNTHYCPNRLLTRAEMSSFLARALRDL